MAKNIGNFLVRSAFKSPNITQSIHFVVADHFPCISINGIYSITCRPCKKIYIGKTGRRLVDRFCKHLQDVEKKNNTAASKPVACHFNLPSHPHHNMTNCGLSLHNRNTESRKNLEPKILLPTGYTLSTRDH